MNKFDSIYIAIKRKAAMDAEHRIESDMKDAFSRMPKSHLAELLYSDPADGRIREIFASVEAEHLLEGW